MQIKTQNVLKFIKHTHVFSNEFTSNIEYLSRKLLEQSLFNYKMDFESTVNDIFNICYSQFIDIVKFIITNIDNEFSISLPVALYFTIYQIKSRLSYFFSIFFII